MSEGTRNLLYTAGMLLVAMLIAASAWFWIYPEARHLETAHQREAEERAEYYTKRADITAANRCADVPAPARSQCMIEEREAARPNQRGEYDLEAQRTVAVWTRAMGLAAIVAMTVGIIGVGLIFVTFRETRRAADAANKTHSAFIAVERPRLIPRVSVVWRTDEDATVRIKFESENMGKTAAYVTKIWHNVMDSPHPTRPLRLINEVGAPVAAGAKAPTGSVSTAPSQHGCDYIGGYIQYSSPFSDDHRAYFCLRVNDQPNNAYNETMATVDDVKGEDWPEDT